MKQLIILLLAIPLLGNGQQDFALGDLLATSSSQNKAVAETKLQTFIQDLKNKKSGSEIAFLRKIFRQTQKTFLNQYDPYSEFNELFTSGKYDCLTATSLFSLVLDRLNIKYNVVETNYHIFLMVRTSKGDVLIETTDRFNGFVTQAGAIEQRIGTYLKTVSSEENSQIYRYHFDLYHNVAPQQLPGLLFYNQAVKAYNTGRLEKSAELLIKAKIIYNSPRIGEFSAILLQSVVTSKLDAQTKQRIQELFRNFPAVLASR